MKYPGFIPYLQPMSGGSPKATRAEEIPSIMVTSDNASAPADNHVQKYIVEEEITVGIPLVRPSAAFLDVLRLAGAKIEVFTKKEICQYLKDYIGARRLYDPTNPSIVYCENDPLETVFGVKSFTINDVLELIQRNVSAVPDTCIKRMRQMVCRTMTVTPPTATPASTNTSANTTDQTSVIPPSQTSFTIPSCKATPIITSTTTTLISSRSSRKRKSESSDPTDNRPVRKRRTSLNVTYSDSETASYPWYFHVKMGKSSDSEKHSVQDNQTVIVDDSSDDLWFVEEDTISVQYDSDAFSVEYDVESITSDLSDTDCSSITSGKDIFVVCQDSDVEFWADSSGTDIESDPEIPDTDKWTCEECKERNTPRQAYCRRCWKLRPGWFEKKGRKKTSVRKAFKRSLSAPGGISSSESSDGHYHRYNRSSSSVISSSDSPATCDKSSIGSVLVQEEGLAKGVTKDDSGISLASGSMCQSSQERGLLSQESIIFSPPARNTLSNFQVVNTTEADLNDIDEVDGVLSCSGATSEKSGRCTGHSTLISSGISISDSGAKNGAKSSAKSAFMEPLKLKKISPKLTRHSTDNNALCKNTPTDLCVVCLSRPKTGSIIHGSSGHQVCCFKCAKHLKKRKKPCPVCRRPIQKVVRNYLL